MTKNIKLKSIHIKITIMAAIFILVLLFSWWKNFRKGIYIGESFFYKIDDSLYKKDWENYINRNTMDSNPMFTLHLNGEELSCRMSWRQDSVTLSYDDGSTVTGTWDGQNLLDADGIPLIFQADTFGVTVTTDGETMSPSPVSKEFLSDALCMIEKKSLTTRGSAGFILAGAFAYLIGVLAFLFPNESHFFLKRWAYRNAELSDEGIFMEKLGGVVCMILGLILVSGCFIS